MDKERQIKISKFLSYVLRHKPEKINIVLDDDGWINIRELIDKSKDEIEFNREDLQYVVDNCDKKRFSVLNDKIRCNQGHTIDIDIKFEKIIPPPILYHGTVEKFLNSIKKNGLLPQKRKYVHLSKDVETANAVGGRRGKPIVLKIDTKNMLRDDFEFFISDNGVYLCKTVPSKYIIFVE